MVVTESHLDQKVGNFYAHILLLIMRQVTEACDHVAEMLDLLIQINVTRVIETKS